MEYLLTEPASAGVSVLYVYPSGIEVDTSCVALERPPFPSVYSLVLGSGSSGSSGNSVQFY